MNNWTIKILLSSIALGLWANIMVPLIRPTTAVAQYETDYVLKSMDIHLQRIEVGIDKIQTGTCTNGKLCR
jgi:hypothetical protein